MTITDVRFSPNLDPETRLPFVGPKGLAGFASCILDDSFFLGNIGVYERLDGGYRLTFPVRISARQKEFKIYFPLTRVVYELLLKAVVDQMLTRTHTLP